MPLVPPWFLGLCLMIANRWEMAGSVIETLIRCSLMLAKMDSCFPIFQFHAATYLHQGIMTKWSIIVCQLILKPCR